MGIAEAILRVRDQASGPLSDVADNARDAADALDDAGNQASDASGKFARAGEAFGSVGGAAGKLALAFSNPVTAAGAVGGIGMVLFRQIVNVMNQKNRYMQTLAKNLYFHALADNRGAMTKLSDRAAEEDFKEEILLYSVLAKEKVNRAELKDVDKAIEDFIERTFGLSVDFELEDALARLVADGIVVEDASGNLSALPPREAAERIDTLWDKVLDLLTDDAPHAGHEVDRPHGGPVRNTHGRALAP